MTPDTDKVTDELPGGELPKAVYRSVAVGFAWMLLAAWFAFSRDGETDFNIAVGIFLFAVFAALPWLIYMTASHHKHAKSENVSHFLSTEIDTWTGPLSGAAAWVQIAIIPAALALAATLIGAVFILSH
jgi:hypothetical protein